MSPKAVPVAGVHLNASRAISAIANVMVYNFLLLLRLLLPKNTRIAFAGNACRSLTANLFSSGKNSGIAHIDWVFAKGLLSLQKNIHDRLQPGFH